MNNSIMRGMPSKPNFATQLASSFNQFKQNPVQFLINQKLNIPNNLQNDPQGIIQHLLNTGQMSQKQLGQLQNFSQRMKGNNF